VSAMSKDAAVQLWRLDADHGNAVKAFDAMGRPAFPTRDQILQLRAAGQASPPETISLSDGSLTVTIPPQGFILINFSDTAIVH
jgi:xylan 1,4-beta-xylosidase